MKKIKYFVLALAIMISIIPANAQFGKNKVQYQTFDWKYIESNYFNVYYHSSAKYLAEFTAITAERALVEIQKLLNYRINTRLNIIVYNSHNEFQQTNVISSFMPEGVGGVTELFKNRVVVPFQGDYGQLHHVIRHELVHAVINEMFYGGSIQSAFTSGNMVQIPLWMNEGICEYSSIGGMDAETDMFMRDVALSGNLPSLSQLYGYYAYRGGQTFYWFVANRYGEERISELINKLKIYGNVERAFQQTFQMDLKDFSEEWKEALKKYYWPDIERFENPEDFARRITDHTEEGNFYNSSPAISPNGERAAFISDRDGIFKVMLMDLDKPEEAEELVSSFRDQDFEDLNLLTPGISWNPQGTKLAISAKSGGQDAIFIVDVDEEEYVKKTFGFTSISSVNWSHLDNRIVFVADSLMQSDIYVYDVDKDEVTRLTDDVFSDFNPVWSHDADKVYFVSDRGNHVDGEYKAKNYNLWNYDVYQRDVFEYDLKNDKIRRLTFEPEYSKTSLAVHPDDKKLLYASDKNGIGNIWELNLIDGSTKPKTNSLTGITQLSITPSGNKLLFTTQIDGGYDLFLIRTPFARELEIDTLPLTDFRAEQLEKEQILDDLSKEEIEEEEKETEEKLEGYGEFEVDFSRQEVVQPNPDAADQIDLEEKRGVTGGTYDDTTFVAKDYKLKFTPDLILGNPGYSTYFGFQGVTQMLFSDILGDHQIFLMANLLIDLRNSNFFVGYAYMPNIIDYHISGFHSSAFVFRPDEYTFRDSLFRFFFFCASIKALYLFYFFYRVEWGINWLNLYMENIDNPQSESTTRMLFVPEGAYVHDDVLYGAFAPVKGTRYNISFKGTPKFGDEGIGFMTITADYRRYFRITNYMSLAFRGAGGASLGPDPRDFFLGGTENWINHRFKGGYLPFEDPEDFAFMQFMMPLRGWAVSEIKGTRFFLGNAEFRFPLFRALLAGPVPILFQSIMGSLFFDIGGAWNGTFDNFKATKLNENGSTRPNDLLMSTGLGIRSYVLGLPVKVDIAWRNEYSGWSQPQYLFSLGYDF
mgnify:FL=1